MIFNIISAFFALYSIYIGFVEFTKNKSLLRRIYFTNKIDYIWAFIISFVVVSSIIFLSSCGLPEFLTWSWLSIFNQKSQNVTLQPFSYGSVIVTLVFWLILSFTLPYLAKIEEEVFRENKITLESRFKYSILFGLAHLIMGVNLIAVLVLSIIGFIFSVFYVRCYEKNIHISKEVALDAAIFKSTSVHSKYNFILITFLALCSILSSIL